MKPKQRAIIASLFSILIFSSCSVFDDIDQEPAISPTLGANMVVLSTPKGEIEVNTQPTTTPFQPAIQTVPFMVFFSGACPDEWKQQFKDISLANSPAEAPFTLSLENPSPDQELIASFDRIFAVASPFNTVADAVDIYDLQAVWKGDTSSTGTFARIFLTQETQQVFRELWGEPADLTVRVVSETDLVSELWNSGDAWGIVPFEEIDPRLKVLRVAGISPLDRPMNVDQYPLTVRYHLVGDVQIRQNYQTELDELISSIPLTNRDESKMTVVVMSGTTALARVTLKKIELNGYEYPIDLVKDWFLSADLRHVSNEVSFMEGCHYTDAYTMQFCSKPDQIQVLENLGINVVESTGNHLNDYDDGFSFGSTLRMYQDRGWINYGGGYNADAAKLPATTEVNGNKIAFIGCNPVGFKWATEEMPGPAKCDYEYYNQTITELKEQGYVVIATFQETEIDLPMYDEYYRTPFKNAARAGADIVQGSQSHVPMGFEFVGSSFIHYGLGNFLFDQMEPHNIREFVDRHVIYNGKYIGTELLTATLMDWCRPVPMTENERILLLDEMFKASRMRLQ